MIYWTEYKGHTPALYKSKNNIYDDTIYTFDIETSSFFKYKDRIVYDTTEYLNIPKSDKINVTYYSCMYIWQFGINDVVYYGRTWDDLKIFLARINEFAPDKKICYIHNLSFEFQYLYSVFRIDGVLARKQRHPFKCIINEYNMELRCSYMLTNCALQYLPKMYKLEHIKQTGSLDYKKMRTPVTKLTKKELKYCEYDCVVLFDYIKIELSEYKHIKNIPYTSTGHVRKEWKKHVYKDYYYRLSIQKMYNTDPHVYNLLVSAFAGGFTHASWYFVGSLLKNVDSFDITSSYPYTMVAEKFPASQFKKCNIKDCRKLLPTYAYLLTIEIKNFQSKYNTTFLSMSKCKNRTGCIYDNGRIVSGDSITTTVTDIDLKLILECYEDREGGELDITVIESWYAVYKYLDIDYVNFILDCYVKKTQYKNIPDMAVTYTKEKNKFNALYGMCVTNLIRDAVEFDPENGWREDRQLTNDEIQDLLFSEQKKGFLNFATGVWVTAYGRKNLILPAIKNDKYVAYMDTDSQKLADGYDRSIFIEYNRNVYKKIKEVSKIRKIPLERFMPEDKKGIKHLLGLYEKEGDCLHTYKKFITQGAKKYAVEENYIGDDKKEHSKRAITVAGVPKSGVKDIKSLKQFTDNLIFTYKNTGKKLLVYADDMQPVQVTDYLGNEFLCTDKTGCCILPCEYSMNKSAEFSNFLSSKRGLFYEGK